MSFNVDEDEIDKIVNQHKALEKECEEQGIPIDSVNYYWHKSKRFSINAKGENFNREAFLEQIAETVKKHAPQQPKVKYKKNKEKHETKSSRRNTRHYRIIRLISNRSYFIRNRKRCATH